MSILLSSDVSSALLPLEVEVDCVPVDTARFVEYLRRPLSLHTPSKNTHEFVLPVELFDVSFGGGSTVSQEKSAASPCLVCVHWNLEGWEKLSYSYLKHMAQEVKSNPKAVPRSLRPFASLMNRLPEHPTGNAAIDKPRKIVLERNIEAIQNGVRTEIASRIRQWTS